MYMVSEQKTPESTSRDTRKEKTVRRSPEHLTHRELSSVHEDYGRTICAIKVMIKVIREVTSGRTANDESPTSPLVRLDTAFSF